MCADLGEGEIGGGIEAAKHKKHRNCKEILKGVTGIFFLKKNKKKIWHRRNTRRESPGVVGNMEVPKGKIQNSFQ